MRTGPPNLAIEFVFKDAGEEDTPPPSPRPVHDDDRVAVLLLDKLSRFGCCCLDLGPQCHEIVFHCQSKMVPGMLAVASRRSLDVKKAILCPMQGGQTTAASSARNMMARLFSMGEAAASPE